MKSASNLLARGVWGGSHIRLDVTERGEARVEFDCAYGTLAGPVALDSGGRFDVRGTFTRERGGPTLVPEGEADGAAPPGGGSQPVPARYAGRVEGERLILTVTPLDSESPLGTFTLVRGQPPVLVKCL